MYQLLFLVHGVGCGERPASDPNWWTDVLASLKASAKPYTHNADFVTSAPKAGQVLVVPLTYHDIFDGVRKDWRAQSQSETGWMPILKQLVPALSAELPSLAAAAGDFFWTHVLDVLLYRFVADYTTPIRDKVALDVATAWHKADLDNGARTPVHFVAHSLGTVVMHDALAKLAAEPGFGAGTHRIESILTLANVSSVLENGNPAYKSVDRPLFAAPPPRGITAAYISIRHELDPIAAVKTFRGDENGWPPTGYQDDVLVDLKKWDPHGYTHYLDNPDAHLRLFQRLWPAEAWNDRWDDAVVRYRNAPGVACPSALAQLRADMRAILQQPRPDSATGLLDAVAKAIGAIETARTACAAEQP